MQQIHQRGAPSPDSSAAPSATSEPTSEHATPSDIEPAQPSPLRPAKWFLWGVAAGAWLILAVETVTAYW